MCLADVGKAVFFQFCGSFYSGWSTKFWEGNKEQHNEAVLCFISFPFIFVCFFAGKFVFSNWKWFGRGHSGKREVSAFSMHKLTIGIAGLSRPWLGLWLAPPKMLMVSNKQWLSVSLGCSQFWRIGELAHKGAVVWWAGYWLHVNKSWVEFPAWKALSIYFEAHCAQTAQQEQIDLYLSLPLQLAQPPTWQSAQCQTQFFSLLRCRLKPGVSAQLMTSMLAAYLAHTQP